jgi:hypothetical protein
MHEKLWITQGEEISQDLPGTTTGVWGFLYRRIRREAKQTVTVQITCYKQTTRDPQAISCSCYDIDAHDEVEFIYGRDGCKNSGEKRENGRAHYTGASSSTVQSVCSTAFPKVRALRAHVGMSGASLCYERHLLIPVWLSP